ncbi:MAG: hypothetical protein ACHQ9S_27165 [Candidatus Binatia bacterium]
MPRSRVDWWAVEADRFSAELARRQAKVQPEDIEIIEYGDGTTSTDRALEELLKKERPQTPQEPAPPR